MRAASAVPIANLPLSVNLTNRFQDRLAGEDDVIAGGSEEPLLSENSLPIDQKERSVGAMFIGSRRTIPPDHLEERVAEQWVGYLQRVRIRLESEDAVRADAEDLGIELLKFLVVDRTGLEVVVSRRGPGRAEKLKEDDLSAELAQTHLAADSAR